VDLEKGSPQQTVELPRGNMYNALALVGDEQAFALSGVASADNKNTAFVQLRSLAGGAIVKQIDKVYFNSNVQNRLAFGNGGNILYVVLNSYGEQWDVAGGTKVRDISLADLGPGRGGDCSPPLPQIRACPTKAPGSSHQGFESRHAIW
jgi:hypothetical protein